MKCPKCGFDCKDSDKFCISCGVTLLTEAPAEVSEVSEAVEKAEEAAACAAEEAVEECDATAAAFAAPVEAAAEEAPVQPAPVQEAPVQPAPQPAPAPQPVYQQPAPAPQPVPEVKAAPREKDEPKEKPAIGRLDKPLTTWGYIWRIILFSIPVLNIIPLFALAFSSGINKNSKRFASAVLILILIAVVIGLAGLVYLLLTKDPSAIANYINRVIDAVKIK